MEVVCLSDEFPYVRMTNCWLLTNNISLTVIDAYMTEKAQKMKIKLLKLLNFACTFTVSSQTVTANKLLDHYHYLLQNKLFPYLPAKTQILLGLR